MDAIMQLIIISFRPLFPDKIFSQILPWLLVKSLTAVKFPDISSFSRQQGDHTPDNVKFPDASRHSSVALGMLSVTHIMLALVLNTCMDANMQFIINSFRQLFPHKIFFPDNSPTFPWFLVKSLTFPWQLSNSLTCPRFPDKCSPWYKWSRCMSWC